MPSNAVRRSRNRSSSTALPKHEPPSNPNNRNQYSTPLMHHASAVHQPVTLTTSPLRPASAAQTSTTMSAASRYAHNLKVLRRRDPSIQRIIDQFSHVCVFHHNGKSWEKQGFEGPMFVYERADYPPYGFYVLNRMGMDDYIQRLWPEDILGVQGNYLWLRSWPEWSRKRICDIEASCGGKELNPFDERYKWDQQSRPIEGTEVYLTIGLWMFTTEVREPLMTVMLRLHDFIAKNLPYPEEYCYGPDNPPPPNPFPFMTNGAPKRTPSAASTASGVSASSSTHTGSANTTSSTRSRRHSPDMAFVSSSIHQMPQSGSMNSNPPDPDVETPKLRSKSLKRKGPRETFPIGSGDVTPMGHGSKQVSDLNTLFARLAQPSVSGRAVNAEPGSSSPSTMNDQPSMLENLMGQRDSIRPVLRSSFMSSSHLPRDDLSIPTKITLEGLFASVLKSPVDNESSNSPLNQNTEDGSIPDRQSRSHSESFHGSIAPETTRLPAGDDPDYRKSPATRTGLALLNDIFASASNSHPVSSGAIPSTSQSHGNFDTENQHALASVRPANSDTQDEPETIEIYSPRPQAPLSLASMFDAAALDDRSTPITGLGLEVNGVEHDHQTILTQSVLDTLLGTGGSMNRENDRSQVDIREEPVEMDGAEVEGVKRRRLLHIIGLRGSSQSPHGQTNANGNITPRGALDDSAESGPSSYAEPVLLNQSVPQTAVSFADTEIMFAEEDDDEPIVELDFSDTQALSDIRVFERRERVLREQLIERRVASRNASRSTTPAVVNFEQGTQPDEMNGAHSGAEVAIIDTHSDPEFTGPVLVDLTPSSQHLPFVKANVLPTSPAQMLQPRVSLHHDPPVTGYSQRDSLVEKTSTGSSFKKKIRRGRGKGKDRGESQEESFVSAVRGNVALNTVVDSSTRIDADGVISDLHQEQSNNVVSEELSNTFPSIGNKLLADVKAQLNASLSFALLERDKSKLDSKKGVVELALTLLQTDDDFVDGLWETWKCLSSKTVDDFNAEVAASGSTLTAPVDHTNDHRQKLDPLHFSLSKSASAQSPAAVHSASDSVKPALLSNVANLVTIKDTVHVEGNWECSPAFGKEHVEEESLIVEILL